MHPTLSAGLVMKAARRRARLVFRKLPDRDELIADTISTAWELLQTAGPNATELSIAWCATKRVKSGRHFKERQRSITGPNPRRLDKPERGEMVDVLDAFADPACLAQIRLDFADWLELLTGRERLMLAAFLDGERTSDLARCYGLSRARVSQIRRELVEHWEVFTS